MADNRTPRDVSLREKNARAPYVPPSTLPEPTPVPGIVFHWVATHVLGQADPSNVSMKMREGWEPVKAEDHPEMMLVGAAKSGNVEIGGLMLCKMPIERYLARRDYYEAQSKAQVDSVDNHYLKESDSRMPMFSEKRSKVSFGSGN